ncbi:CHAT domain-containing protein [Microcoleus sp. FACHB-1515]|uniref:CHAT domain-containing protein n=1 Tax=Cyanophyceae TaxID=3028117 RepID=UPI00168774C4|nr:CHAT domain-containing protein [Microcoleus sp. FACHB-1515]MBD2088929.1 CHAT domain-containing protein [Microcoleus sp. FACHB-1515]
MKRWSRRLKHFGLGLLFILSLMLTAIDPTPLAAQAIDPAGLVQQGVDRYQAGAVQSAIESWQAALSQYQASGEQANAAIVLENLARAYQQIGQTNQEIQYWQQAAAHYRQAGDRAQWGRMLTEQAQAHRRLGQSRQAIALLCGATPPDCLPESALQLARTSSDRLGEAAALGSLGEAYRTRGDYQRAIELLSASHAVAQDINQLAYQAAALNGLGNAQLGLAQISYRRAIAAAQVGRSNADELEQAGREQDATAIRYFQQSLTIAEQQGDRLAQLRAIVAALPAYYRTETLAAAARQQAIDLLSTLPNSPDKVYLAVDLVHLLEPAACAASPTALALLQQAVLVAQQLDDPRSESFALGELGRFYECQRDYEQAIALTQQARWAAEQDLRAQDSLYLWEWQTGRILAAQGKIEAAIAAYDKAVTTLETIRSELLSADRDLQFDFRDTVDPVYRELVELRLSTAAPENISAALQNLDALRLAELQNYFGDDCVIVAAPRSIDAVPNAATAIFSSVVLADRTAVILSLPNGEQQIHWIDIDRDRLTAEVNDYRQQLERFYRRFDPQQAEKMYGWLIAPFAEVLEQFQVKTLVFVQDGILRSVPMAALYDGEQYLIQKYAIATTPSLTLTEAQPLDRSRLRVLVLGLTQAAEIDGQTFPALSNVNREVAAIEAELNSTPLLDQNFTSTRLQQALSQASYPIIHMATHGQFSTVPDDTFLITGDRQKLTITDLDRILRQTATTDSIELLSLTACQTAVGDDRAALGLAGVAIQAGVRSALASLWFIDDAATAQLATEFYANLQNPNMSRADALRAAQISLLENRQTANPAYWAPFILIGNWL